MTMPTSSMKMIVSDEEIAQRARAAGKSGFPLTAVLLLKQLRRSTTLAPHQTFLLADSLRLLGLHREALVLFEQLWQLDVSNKNRWLVPIRIGNIWSSLGDLTRAEAAFREAAKLNPSSTVPWVYLGTTIAKSGRFDEAIEAYRSGLDAQGDLDEVYMNLGYSLMAVGRLEEAKDAFRSAIAITSDYDEANDGLLDLECAIATGIQPFDKAEEPGVR